MAYNTCVDVECECPVFWPITGHSKILLQIVQVRTRCDYFCFVSEQQHFTLENLLRYLKRRCQPFHHSPWAFWPNSSAEGWLYRSNEEHIHTDHHRRFQEWVDKASAIRLIGRLFLASSRLLFWITGRRLHRTGHRELKLLKRKINKSVRDRVIKCASARRIIG